MKLGLKKLVGLSALTLFAGASSVLLLSALEAETLGKLDISLARELQTEPSQNRDILVRLRAQANLSYAQHIREKSEKTRYVYENLTRVASKSQSDLVAFLNSESLKYRQFYIVNMIWIEGASPSLINILAARNDVAKIYADKVLDLRPPTFEIMETMSTSTIIETSLQHIGAERVWNENRVKGQGIVVAGQDTGVEWDHPALIRQYRGSKEDGPDHNYNWYDAISDPIGGGSSCGYNTQEPCDDNDHGTHTLGTVLGDDHSGNQIGVAPESQWIACRNMDAGKGRPYTYMACFEFFMAPFPLNADPMTDGDPNQAPHVVNNSWGCPSEENCQGDVLLEILRAMKAAGIFVVVSAGNEGPSCGSIQNTPAWHSADTFSVGAYDHRRRTIAGFSSRGPSKFDGAIGPDIVAPGVSIRSAVRGHKYAGGFWSGTSMAGPHVAGVVALMWSAQPNLIGQIDETSDILRSTATPVPSNGCMGNFVREDVVPNNYYGYGVVNAYEAVKQSLKR